MPRMQNGDSFVPSGKADWETPPELMAALYARFGHFDLDPCASHATSKATYHYSLDIRRDGLTNPWFGRVYMNPPYGRGIKAWVKKAFEQVRDGYADAVVALLPVSTDTEWWQTYVTAAAFNVYFLKGRVKFVGAPGPAPFASAIVVWRKEHPTTHCQFYNWDWKR